MSDTNRNTVITPLIPTKPRLRFMTDAGAGAAPDPAAQAAAAKAAKDAADAAAKKAAEDAASAAPWTKDNFDPDRAFRLVENLRGDLEAQKTKFAADLEAATTAAGKQAAKDALAGIAKLLAGDEPVETDPEKLQAKVTDLSTQIKDKDSTITKGQADLKAAALEREVAIIGIPLGANIRTLLTNEDFKNSIASVEPTDEAAITAAITKALQANAALKQPPTRSGAGDHTGPTIQTLESQLKAAEEKKDWRESIRLKRAIAAAKSTT